MSPTSIIPNRQHFIEELKLAGFSANTIDVYVRSVRQLSDYLGKHPSVLNDDDIRTYLLHLKNNVSVQTYNIAVTAIGHFYRLCVPQRPAPKYKSVRVPFKLPPVLSSQEIKLFFDHVTSLKYKTIFSLMYSSGIRIGECTNLKPQDIDSKKMLILIKQAKGNKDRFAPLGNTALGLLRHYYTSYHPSIWLFEGRPKGTPLHVRSIQKVFKQVVRDAGIQKAIRPHTLRHNFATHLLEQKCPLPAIQQFLGHRNINSTVKYTHISPKTLSEIINPLDALMASESKEVRHD